MMSAVYSPGGLELPGAGYRLYRLATRPWALIRDTEGFLEERCNAYLLFAAWQDRSRRQVVADARWLTLAATWVREDPQGAWETTDLDGWAAFVQGIALERFQRHQQWERPVSEAVEALHRAYAFWHWAEPERFTYQPFPATVKDRQHWSRRVTEIVDYLPDDLP
ncbi:MAG: hypothetical protein M0Z36_08015 [Thermaerobacter sp.]|nr:hypothetical protein [Thermaerobacter sp.]